MVIDFSVLDWDERPLWVLCAASGIPIQPFGMAYNHHANLHYNETSEITFDLPAFVDGVDTPHYADVKGMHYILWPHVGFFVLNNPEVEKDGVVEVKHCTAYSAEYEFTFKQITLEAGTYCFYDPVNSNTLMGRIMELMPGWSIGSVSEDLWAKYRTFDDTTANVYDFIKGTVQETCGCIFDFDILHRRVHVRSMEEECAVQPVYISLRNLAKEIEIGENTDNLFTCLDVNGAEGVTIRSVNPLGTNKIYDLSYFMTESNVGPELARKWQEWQTAFADAQLPYFNVTVEEALQQARLDVAGAKLATLKGELSTLEALQSTYVEASASGSDDTMAERLKQVKREIADKKREITEQETEVTNAEAAVKALHAQLVEFNEALAFEKHFTPEQILVLNQYIKEDALQETTFVAPVAAAYTTNDVAGIVQEATSLDLSGSAVTFTKTSSNKDIFTFRGGNLTLSVDGTMLSAKVVRGSMERSAENELLMTASLGDGSYGDQTKFKSGCVSLTGTSTSLSHTDTGITSASGGGFFFLTENTTEYQQRSVEWDLLDYAKEQLKRLAYPSYSFSVESGNFLCMEDFVSFRNELKLGEKLYLDLGDADVLKPILIGCEFGFEDQSDFTLEFGDTYSCLDAEFKLTDLLEQSISSGKSADFSKFTASQWVDSGASSAVEDFIKSALDASKNAIISGSDQSIVFDQSGFRLRKMKPDGSGYEDEQIWMINNSIAFTADGWNSAKMAIGKFHDENTGDAWGIVAPSIVGTLLAGEGLVIESEKKDGDVAVFRVDGDGCRLYNSRFDLVNEYGTNTKGQISMFPPVGFVGGNTTSSSPLFSYDENGDCVGVMTDGGNVMADLTDLDKTDLPNAAFWIDMKGNAYFKGTVYATDGQFSGTVYASDGEFTGTVHATDGDFSGTLKATKLAGTLEGINGGEIKGVSLGIGGTNYNNFIVDSNGNVTMRGNINLSGGNITWGANAPDTGLTEDEVVDLIYDNAVTELPDYIYNTYIDSTEIRSPEITGNNIRALKAFAVGNDGYMGKARGLAIRDDGWGTVTTYGVAMAAGTTPSDGLITFDSIGNYVIATDAGVRMTYNDGVIAHRHELTVTANGCFADGLPIGTGSGGGTVTAVWG